MTHKPTELFEIDDTRAASSVIGVILVVAITVILAAVISTSVLGVISTLKEPTPVVQLSVADASADAPPPRQSTNGEVTNWAEISHNNGDVLNANDLKILVKNSNETTVATLQQSNSYSYYAADPNDYLELYSDSSQTSRVDLTSTLTAGDTWYIVVDNDQYPANELGFPDGQYTIVMVHNPSESTISQSEVTIR